MSGEKDRRGWIIVILLLLLLLLCLLFSHGAGTHTVTVETEGGGYADPSGTIEVRDGDDLMVVLHPDDGCIVSAVEVDGEDVYDGGEVLELLDIDRDLSVRVLFASHRGMHEITASSSAGGSISPSGTVAVPEGGDIAFTMTEDEGYLLSALYVDGIRVDAVGGEYVFEDVSGNHAIHAVFSHASDPGVVDGFSVDVTKVEGIRADRGRAEMFTDARVRPLSEGDPFLLEGMFPGMWQTATLEISNGTDSDAGIVLKVSDTRGSGDLARRAVIIVNTDHSTDGAALSDVEAHPIDLGTLPAGSSAAVKVTLVLPGESSGNETMDGSLSFRLSVEASA